MSPHKLLLATRNKGKIEEFRRILDDIAAGEIDLVGLDQFPELHDVEETGSTFEENALLKARQMCIRDRVCSGDGRFIEVQGTAEGVPFDRDLLDSLLDLAVKGCVDLGEIQKAALAK